MASSATRDYYQVLGVAKSATDKDILSAYRRLARKHHPDLNPGDRTAESRFKELQTAYDVLSDPNKRKKYDRFGANWEQVERGQAGFASGPARDAGPSPRFDFSDLGDTGDQNDLFENLFGNLSGFGRGGTRARSGPRSRVRVGENIEQAVEISLEEAYHGASRLIEMPTSTGASRRVEARIPPGVKTGSKVRLAGEGAPGSGGGASGDLFLEITVRPHGLFDRRDDDLTCEVTIPLTTAVLGGEVQVPTIKGGKVALKIPAETQNSQTFRLGGLGMPRSGAGHGDMFAKLKVTLPTRLTARQRELFEQIAREQIAQPI